MQHIVLAESTDVCGGLLARRGGEESIAVKRHERPVNKKVGMIHCLTETTQQVEDMREVVQDRACLDVSIL